GVAAPVDGAALEVLVLAAVGARFLGFLRHAERAGGPAHGDVLLVDLAGDGDIAVRGGDGGRLTRGSGAGGGGHPGSGLAALARGGRALGRPGGGGRAASDHRGDRGHRVVLVVLVVVAAAGGEQQTG